jgi:hypothetical protein
VLAKLFRPFLEGSLLKRTLLYVGTLVLASGAFIAITSLVLVSIVKGLVPSSTSGGERTATAASTAEAAAGDEDDTAPATGAPGAIRPRLGGARHQKKRLGAPPVTE